MKKIMLMDIVMSERGTTVSTYDYATHLQEDYGFNPILCYDKSHPANCNLAIERIKKRFDLISWENSFDEIKKYVVKNNIEYFYCIKTGNPHDGYHMDDVDGVKTLIHSVFSTKREHIHGDVWATVSKWQSSLMGDDIPFVPHMVKFPDTGKDFRDKLGIPKSDLVLGRYGGLDTWDVPFIDKAVTDALNRRSDLWIVLMNTPKGINHERCIYLDRSVDMDYKSSFVNTCDAMMHGGFRGETFGIAVLEFAIRNKQIIAFDNHIGGRNHHQHLKNNYFMYSNPQNLIEILMNLEKESPFNTRYLGEIYSPQNVMKKFNEVFL